MLTFVIVSNWSRQNKRDLIELSESDGIGTCVPRESITGDMALIELDDSHFEEGGQFYDNADYEVFDEDRIKREINTSAWNVV
jgi:hypothetical protein